MKELLTIKHLSWQINNKNILQNISFAVEQGEIIGIIGPNGAGKTSLLRCLLNHQQDFTGDISFKNKNIKHYSARELAQHFSLVAQKAAPLFDLSVFDVVKMGLLPHKKLFALDTDHDLHQIELALEKVGLLALINTPFNLLSGGEQQRVFIARALVQKADVLILDEPTNHLDVYYQHQILSLVTSLNMTVIMTVHDLNLAAQYCQRLLLLDQGELISDGTPEKVLNTNLLSKVFKLHCIRDKDPITQKLRVAFYPKNHKEVSAHDDI